MYNLQLLPAVYMAYIDGEHGALREYIFRMVCTFGHCLAAGGGVEILMGRCYFRALLNLWTSTRNVSHLIVAKPKN